MVTLSGEIAGRIEEFTSLITPADGVSILQALLDAELAGFESITIHPDNTATVLWFRKD